jgi:hypothetical protein
MTSATIQLETMMEATQVAAACKKLDASLRTYHDVSLLLAHAPSIERIEELLTREMQTQRRYSVMKRLYTRFDQLRHREEMALIDAVSLEQGKGRSRL